MLKIGEFSTLTQVSIKTLRHYDEMGLLKPVRIDPESGYRYYSAIQLPRLHRILALKDLGFPLHRIAEVVDRGIGEPELRGMLMLRHAEQESRVQEEVERLARLKARLRLIELEDAMASDVVLKRVATQWIASIREVIPAYRMVGILFGKLFELIGQLELEGIGAALWHDSEYKDKNLDVEVGVLVKQPFTVPQPLSVHELPAVTVASIIHHGAFNRIGEAYQAVLRWIEANGYSSCGPTREIFLRVATPVKREDESNVTEIQVAVDTI